MERLSILAAMGLLFVITSQAAAGLPGDVGTPECREVQLDAQSAVSSGGPYKNPGQLVSTAAKVVSAAVAAKEIAAECSSCIMNQFARSIAIKDQEACGPDLCAVSGGPGWGNEIHVGGNGASTADTTPQACCQSCVDNPDCTQWVFFSDFGLCSHNVPPGQCVAPDLTPVVAGGIIRCP